MLLLSILASAETKLLHIPDIPLEHEERVVGLQIDLAGWYFVSVENLSVGWEYDISHPYGENNRLTGTIVYGCSALNRGDPFPKITIGNRDGTNKGGKSTRSIRVTVSITDDFHHFCERDAKFKVR